MFLIFNKDFFGSYSVTVHCASGHSDIRQRTKETPRSSKSPWGDNEVVRSPLVLRGPMSMIYYFVYDKDKQDRISKFDLKNNVEEKEKIRA